MKRRFIFLLICWSLIACAPAIQDNLSMAQKHAREQKIVSLLQQAVVNFRLGTEEALDQSEASLLLAKELIADDPRVIDGLGCVAWRRGDQDLAMKYFQRAITLDSEYDRAYAHLAFIAMQRGDHKAAQELLLIAVNKNPVNYRSRNNFAVALLQDGGHDQARRKLAYQELLKAANSGAQSGRGKLDPVIEFNLNAIAR